MMQFPYKIKAKKECLYLIFKKYSKGKYLVFKEM